MGRVWAIALPLLAACVFLWGLEYKLSLYFPPQASFHQVPIAKLLSKNEQATVPAEAFTAKSDRSRSDLGGSVPQFAPQFPALLLIPIAALALLGQRRLVVPVASLHSNASPFRAALFVRPPPIL